MLDCPDEPNSVVEVLEVVVHVAIREVHEPRICTHYCPRKKLTLQSLIKNGMLSYQIVKIEQCGFLFDSARRVCALTPFDQIREMCPIGQRDTH